MQINFNYNPIKNINKTKVWICRIEKNRKIEKSKNRKIEKSKNRKIEKIEKIEKIISWQNQENLISLKIVQIMWILLSGIKFILYLI